MRRNVPSTAQVRGWKITAPSTSEIVAIPACDDQPDRGPLTVRHGYTLADINGIAIQALRMDRWNGGDTDERYAAIWHAIAEDILSAETAPGRQSLLTTGIHAADRHVHAEMRHAGRDPVNIGRTIPGYERYWSATPTPSPETRVVERTALYQVLPLLTQRQREALMALAVHEDYSAAAQAIGSTYKTYCTLIIQARVRIYRAWHQGETAPTKPWRKDIRESRPLDTRGKARLTVSEVEALRTRYVAGEKLRAVATDAGVPVSTLSALLRGTRTPAPDPVGA
jgi:hypothetical protein